MPNPSAKQKLNKIATPRLKLNCAIMAFLYPAAAFCQNNPIQELETWDEYRAMNQLIAILKRDQVEAIPVPPAIVIDKEIELTNALILTQDSKAEEKGNTFKPVEQNKQEKDPRGDIEPNGTLEVPDKPVNRSSAIDKLDLEETVEEVFESVPEEPDIPEEQEEWFILKDEKEALDEMLDQDHEDEDFEAEEAEFEEDDPEEDDPEEEEPEEDEPEEAEPEEAEPEEEEPEEEEPEEEEPEEEDPEEEEPEEEEPEEEDPKS